MSSLITTSYESPLGPLTLAAVDEGVCVVAFPARTVRSGAEDLPARSRDDVSAVGKRLGVAARTGRHPHLDRLSAELTAYFAGRLRRFTVPLVAAGTPFQQRVWTQLQQIPYGSTWSYEQLAHAVGVAEGQRAVGHANGSNPIAIVIPCHRVINKNGRLGGYGGELWRKEALLELERGTPRLNVR